MTEGYEPDRSGELALVVVGGGVAGLFAALCAASLTLSGSTEPDAQVTVSGGAGPLPEEKIPERRYVTTAADRLRAREEFDTQLNGATSRLVGSTADAESVVAQAFRYVLGLSRSQMDDDRALDELLNPARNRYRLETLNVSMHSPMMRALEHASYTFLKKLSHTADSQDQRHRMVPGSRPLLTLTDTRQPDFITPMLIRENSRALELYEQCMADAWSAKNELLNRGVPAEIALYLLPNAKSIRLVESGSLLHLLHKWTMRTCFNAQEEIYAASLDEIRQVQARHPRFGRHLGPPCVIRNGLASPRCTEGSHFCGVPVWRDWPGVERRL